MNAQPETTATETEPASASNPQPEQGAPLLLQTLDFGHGTLDSMKTLHRKIGKLPAPLRDLINTMLDDNFPAREIIAKLQASTAPPLPYPINEKNISDWKATGFRDYLAHQDRLEDLRISRKTAMDMVASDDTTTLPEATLQIIASQYYHLLGNFSPDSLKEKLAEDPLKYTRFLNVFARLTREILLLKKHREASAQAAAAGQLQQLDHTRNFSDREDQMMTGQWDAVFKRPRKKRSAGRATGQPLPGGEGRGEGERSPIQAEVHGEGFLQAASPRFGRGVEVQSHECLPRRNSCQCSGSGPN